MNDSKNKFTEEELKLIEETERFMEEVNRDPEVANLTAPPEMKEKIFAEIRARETANTEKKLREEAVHIEKEFREEINKSEEQELIRLGRIYKKKRKARKYLVLAAAVVCALALGITSMGGPEQIFERVKSAFMERERVHVDSQEIEPVIDKSEEEAYQKIEDAFGFYPIRLCYLPENITLLDAKILDQIQGATLIYGEEDEAKIIYVIRPNYRISSIGEDIEDEVLEEYTLENENAVIYIRKCLIENKEERWTAQFTYQDVSYFIQICDTAKEEVTKIVENLYFP